MRKESIPEAKSLRWLANMFPFVENPQDEADRVSNCIHLYCTAGADKLEEFGEMIEFMNQKINQTKGENV